MASLAAFRARAFAARPRLGFVVSRAFSSEAVEVDIPTKFETHHLENAPAQKATTTKDEMLGYFKLLAVMRRMEIVCDNLYKAKMIRGFCHLYDGQEACAVGIDAGLKPGDSLITAYRDHCHMLVRGGTVEGIVAEMLGRTTGHSKGKGGSMHFYNSAHRFYGGNGIVGAQIPVGAGVAFKHKYDGDGGVCVACFGDGAANQGQLYEAMNMAYLWKLPVIFLCENNHFGMGTSVERASAETAFFKRGHVVPGIRIDGMDVYAVREGIRFSAQRCRDGLGPIYVELDTYRYHGHSMSDPGSTYRSREDIDKVRSTRDPLERVRNRVVELGFASTGDLKAIERDIRKDVDDAVEAAKAAPEPDFKELYTNVYDKNEIPIRSPDGYSHAFA
eukprot:c5337_g1_i1.p1 GENE.c5337_g1_i1~~c5337_g1_i1.p1  ORF type:complete len:403 (-),score=97.69 c5337_g1_i1:236-1399(-)